MKIKFIGTSHGIPEKDRFCSCTVVSINGSHYIIDAGISLASALIRNGYALEDVRGVFITHNHGDHSNGLAEFIDLLSWSKKTLNPAVFMPTREAADAMMQWVLLMDGGRELEISVTSVGTVYEDENVKISAVLTKHTTPSYAYILETADKRVVFTGDMSRSLEDYPSIILEKDCDMVVCESAHNRLDEAVDIIGKSRTPLMVINHINPKHSIDDFTRCKPLVSFKMVLANDLDEFEV